MNTLSKLLLGLMAFALTACQATDERSVTDDPIPVQQTSTDDARNELLRLNDLWMEYSNAGDYDSLVGLYAPDAIVISPEGTYRGRDEIRADFQAGHVEGATGTVTADHIQVAQSGELAYMYGSWTSTTGRQGMYVSVLGKENGQWMWLSDAYNLSADGNQ